MPYRRGQVYWCRVPARDGTHVLRSTGSGNKGIATTIDGLIARLRDTREWAVLDAVTDRRVSLGTLYDHRTDLSVITTTLADIDLRPLATEWLTTLQQRELQSATRYHRQVTTFLTSWPTRSTFTRATVSSWLSQSLSSRSRSTRTRYRAALGVFASWLVDRGILPFSPVPLVKGHGNNRPRTTWIERTDAEALVRALPSPHREMAAIMCGTGMEQQAVLRLRRKDVDERKRVLFANGGKTDWRQRYVRCTESWCWPLFKPALEGLTPHALVFGRGASGRDNTVGASQDYHMRQVLAHAAFRDYPRMTPHDFRHCYAVWSLRDGMNPRTVQRQLGHAKLSMTLDVYGQYVADRDSDYEIPAQRRGHIR